MSKMNKIITNNSVQLSESEVNNLIVTLGPVIEAFTGGGGGQGSVIYTPGDDNISINNTQHTIALSTDAATKLNTPIPTKVSDLTDSANYATVDAINAKLDKDEFAALSGDFATEQYVQAASAEVTDWVNNQHYLTQVPDTYYLKTETSGKDELSAAFNDILKYNVTAAAGIEITTATDAGVKTFGISMTAEPVVTDTTLSGYNGIAATRDAEVNNQWNIGLTQDQLNTINEKLDSSDFTTYTGTTAPNTYLTKTSADTLYQPTGDYVTTADVLTGTSNTLTGIKIGSINYTIPTTDLSDYYTKTQVDSTFASATQLNDYLTTAKYQTDSAAYAKKTDLEGFVTSSDITTQDTDYVMTTTGWKVLTLPGGGMTQVIHDTTLTGQGNADNSKLGVAWSALSGNTIASANNAGSAASAYIASYYYKANTDTPTSISAAIKTIDDANTRLFEVIYEYPEYLPRETPIYADYALSAYINENTISSFSDYSNAINAKLDTTAAVQTYLTTATYAADSATFLTKSSADNDYAPKSITATVNTLTAASAGWNNKVDKPTSLVDKYLVLRTDTNGAVSGWCDFQDQSYSKSEALGTFVATANIDTTTLSGDGKSVSTKLGVKTDVIATTDYVNSSFLPTSGGTVSGQLEVHGGSTFDQQFLKITRENVNGHARLGLGQYGALALKADDSNNHTTQVNISPNASNDQLVQVQHNGGAVGYLIPAVTATTTAGLTDDGILHIIVEN